MSNKRDLKAFVRYDGSGRVVAGSLILRKQKPKVGKWTEVQGYECCNFIPPVGPASCATLGRAAGFSVLTNTAITHTGGVILVDGDIGLSPGNSATNLAPIILNGTQYIATVGTPNVTADNALIDALVAYNCLSLKVPTSTISNALADEIVTPGVYDFPATTLGITGTVILDGLGDPNAVFIFKIGTSLTTAVNSSVVLINGAQAGNVYWLAGAAATTGVGSTMVGNIITNTAATINGSLTGRVISLGAAITFVGNITNASCTVNPCI